MRKIAVLIKRRPDLAVAGFQDQWRRDRAVRMAKLPGLHRYVQSHPLTQGYAKGELLFDGLEEFWVEDAVAARQAIAAQPDPALVDPARTVTMLLDVIVIKDGAIPQDAVKNVEFVNRRPGMALAPFRDYWRTVHGPLAARIPVLRRYEQNHLALDEYRAGEPAYDGLAITWFASTADMKAGTRTPEYAETRADEPHFLPDGHLPIIITREHTVLG